MSGLIGAAPLETMSLAVKVAGEMKLPAVYVEVLRNNTCRDLNDAEIALFLTRCARKNLDPFEDVAVWKDSTGKIALQVRIDKMRALSRSSGYFAGRKVELITVPEHPEQLLGARCTVTRTDVPEPFVAEVLLKEFYKPTRSGEGPWDRMPETMIKKVAESHALRAAFPEELAGLYTEAEIQE